MTKELVAQLSAAQLRETLDGLLDTGDLPPAEVLATEGRGIGTAKAGLDVKLGSPHPTLTGPSARVCPLPERPSNRSCPRQTQWTGSRPISQLTDLA